MYAIKLIIIIKYIIRIIEFKYNICYNFFTWGFSQAVRQGTATP